jgi:CRISPR-associated protein (TIGR03986 family)
MTRFHSPYQFIPVSGQIHRTDAQGEIVRQAADDDPLRPRPVQTTDYAAIRDGETQARHDLWQADLQSGRLLCRIRTRTPVLIGAEQQDDQTNDPRNHENRPGRIHNYQRDGQAALPANSLRGMIASTAEALSQSAMRILPDARYHQRMDMYHSFKALGLLQQDGEHWRLLPLALTYIPILPQPNDRRTSEEYAQQYRLASHDREQFKGKWLGIFPGDAPLSGCLAAYFGHYQQQGDLSSDLECYQSCEAAHYHHAPQGQGDLDKCTLAQALTMDSKPQGLERKGNIALRHLGAMPKQPTGSAEPADQSRGLLYILGKTNDMRSKLHEWFLPYAPDWDDHVQPLWVPPCVIDRFEQIAAERVPHIPRGYRERDHGRGPRRADGSGGFLRHGDLVYFDVDQDGQGITAISWSAIWRDAVPGSLHGAFRNHAGKDLLPWSLHRDALTPAELLFGVVEEQGGDKVRNLASRVRFSDARASGEVRLLYQTPPAGTDSDSDIPGALLRPQQSPKPPSPAMYFHAADGTCAVRAHQKQPPHGAAPTLGALDLEHDRPNGRKQFQARMVSVDENQRPYPWEIAPDDQHSMEKRAKLGARYGNPIAKKQVFWFHVDFDNLTQAELDLLCIALQPALFPIADEFKEGFLHRIGWGKPLGLGAIELEVAGLFLTSRGQRYRPTALREPRYQLLWRANSLESARQGLSKRYPDALETAANLRLGARLDTNQSLGDELIDAEAFRVLTRIGNPKALEKDADGKPLPVVYPHAENPQISDTDKGYQWFVNNNRANDENYQHLQPVSTGPDATVPSLSTNK